MSQCLSGSGCSKDQENYDWTTAGLISELFIVVTSIAHSLYNESIQTWEKDTNKMYRLPLFYNRWKKTLCNYSNDNLQLEMTQSSPIAMNLMNLTKNMNFTLKCSECLTFKLILMQWTNYHDIILNVVICGHRKSLGTTHNAIKQM